MNRFLPLVILSMLCHVAFCQQTFLYSKAKEIQLKSDSSSIVFADYKKMPDGSRERIVTCNGSSYRIIMKKVRGLKLQEILDDQGQKKATIFFNTSRDSYKDILLPDGTQLDWSGITKNKWSFSHNGKIVIGGTLQKQNGKKQILITGYDSSFPLSVLQIATLERGTDKIVSSSTTPVYIGVGVVLAVMRAAVSSNDNSSP